MLLLPVSPEGPRLGPTTFPEALGAILLEDQASQEPLANGEVGRGSAGRRPWGPATGSERHRPWAGLSPEGLGAGPACSPKSKAPCAVEMVPRVPDFLLLVPCPPTTSCPNRLS